MSPRTSAANQEIKDRRREEILLAALDVFAAKGLSDAKISDIASAAHISQGLIHHYFPSKESVYTAVADRAMQGALQAVTNAHTLGGDPWQKLVLICGRMLDGLHVYPQYLLIVVQCLLNESTPPAARELVLSYSRTILTNLTELIRDGQAARQIVAQDPQELAMTFLALIQGLALSQFTRRAFMGDAVSFAGKQGGAPLPRTERGAQQDGTAPDVETVLRIFRAQPGYPAYASHSKRRKNRKSKKETNS